MAKKNYIKIYADEYSSEDWAAYCRATGAPSDAFEITIRFNDEDVSYKGPTPFTVDIFDSEGDYVESFDIEARDEDAAQEIVDSLFAATDTHGAFCDVVIHKDDYDEDNIVYTMEQVGSADDEEYIMDNYASYLTFKLQRSH